MLKNWVLIKICQDSGRDQQLSVSMQILICLEEQNPFIYDGTVKKKIGCEFYKGNASM